MLRCVSYGPLGQGVNFQAIRQFHATSIALHKVHKSMDRWKMGRGNVQKYLETEPTSRSRLADDLNSRRNDRPTGKSYGSEYERRAKPYGERDGSTAAKKYGTRDGKREPYGERDRSTSPRYGSHDERARRPYGDRDSLTAKRFGIKELMKGGRREESYGVRVRRPVKKKFDPRDVRKAGPYAGKDRGAYERGDKYNRYRSGEDENERRERSSPSSNNDTEETDWVESQLKEFDNSSEATKSDCANLPKSFSSPPLLPGLAQSINEFLGKDAKPTAIQALSLQELASSSGTVSWRQCLLASETGSGKSFAYLLPLIQHLKESEATFSDKSTKEFPLNPRALVLAPTHELARQLSSFAKALVHHEKLRVLCASRANVPNQSSETTSGLSVVGGSSARQMKHSLEALSGEGGSLEIGINSSSSHRPVDILVTTPMKALELVRGWGWNKEKDGRQFTPSKPEMGMKNIEHVVVDEADVLYDPDFQETTLSLLSSISEARGHALPLPSPLPYSRSSQSSPAVPLTYPFHLTLTSATIPASLSTFLADFHPNLKRLVSPGVHRLPATLRTQIVKLGSGNRFADIEARIKEVWKEDALRAQFARERDSSPESSQDRAMKGLRDQYRSKILVFCNRETGVSKLGEYLSAKGISNIMLSGSARARVLGSNRHLANFLKPISTSPSSTASSEPTASEETEEQVEAKTKPSKESEKDAPNVLITTSLLSRGLDFAPSVRHVFIADAPRNMIDFIHRAGRSGRAGEPGKVVVFGKMKGRGSSVDKNLRKRMEALRG